jgi:NitT/TauT family transport system ATP-binding protein
MHQPPFSTNSLDAPETAASPPVAVRARDLRVSYGSGAAAVPAVAGVSFDVVRGEFLTLIGPSGCGKTSILRGIGGLLPSTPQGELAIAGRPVTGPLPDDVAYVFQDFGLFPWRTALGNVEIALELRGVKRSERRDRAREVLERVGLGDVLDRQPSQLSGGMQQRVAIARALVSDCDILLLDEPFGALDEQTRLVLGAELTQLLEAASKTIVFVTHSLQEAVYLSDRVIALTKSPCTIDEVLTIDLPRPRTPEMIQSPEFQQLQGRLFSCLYDQSRAALMAGEKS